MKARSRKSRGRGRSSKKDYGEGMAETGTLSADPEGGPKWEKRWNGRRLAPRLHRAG